MHVNGSPVLAWVLGLAAILSCVDMRGKNRLARLPNFTYRLRAKGWLAITNNISICQFKDCQITVALGWSCPGKDCCKPQDHPSKVLEI